MNKSKRNKIIQKVFLFFILSITLLLITLLFYVLIPRTYQISQSQEFYFKSNKYFEVIDSSSSVSFEAINIVPFEVQTKNNNQINTYQSIPSGALFKVNITCQPGVEYYSYSKSHVIIYSPSPFIVEYGSTDVFFYLDLIFGIISVLILITIFISCYKNFKKKYPKS